MLCFHYHPQYCAVLQTSATTNQCPAVPVVEMQACVTFGGVMSIPLATECV